MGIIACQEADPTGTTKRRRHERVPESQAFAGDALANLRHARGDIGAAEVIPAHVVGHDDKDIRRQRRRSGHSSASLVPCQRSCARQDHATKGSRRYQRN